MCDFDAFNSYELLLWQFYSHTHKHTEVYLESVAQPIASISSSFSVLFLILILNFIFINAFAIPFACEFAEEVLAAEPNGPEAFCTVGGAVAVARLFVKIKSILCDCKN